MKELTLDRKSHSPLSALIRKNPSITERDISSLNASLVRYPYDLYAKSEGIRNSLLFFDYVHESVFNWIRIIFSKISLPYCSSPTVLVVLVLPDIAMLDALVGTIKEEGGGEFWVTTRQHLRDRMKLIQSMFEVDWSRRSRFDGLLQFHQLLEEKPDNWDDKAGNPLVKRSKEEILKLHRPRSGPPNTPSAP